MALSDFTGPHYIDDWTSDLDNRWPERTPVSESVVQTILSWCKRHSDRSDFCILELGVGAGRLSEAVLKALESEQIPPLSFVGCDLNPELTQYTMERLRGISKTDVNIKNINLNDENWTDDLVTFDIVYTLQTLHDLGGQASLTAVYKRIFSLLAPGGLLVNADFVVPFSKDNPHKPRRFPVETHHQLLESIGFVQFKTEMCMGKLACLSAVRP